MKISKQEVQVVTRPAMRIRLPWQLLIAMSAFIVFSVMISGVLVAARQEPADPFAAYAALLGADLPQSVLGQDFTCRESGACVQRFKSGVFSRISLAKSEGGIDQINFSVQPEALRLGDLVLLWGQPEILSYCETSVATWQSQHISALITSPTTRRPGYYSAVTAVAITQHNAPRWQVQLLNEALHDCGGIQSERLHVHPGWA